MTFPLMALAVGAMVAGFVGIPAVFGVTNQIEHFLEPSFTASHHVSADTASHAATLAGGHAAEAQPAAEHGGAAAAHAPKGEHGAPHASAAVELGLMAFSVLVAAVGIGLAWRFYVVKPEISEDLAIRFAGAHRTLTNKYYVDELYEATAVSGTMAAGRSLWNVDRNVVDGAVNGTGWITLFSSWVSGLTDKRVVDGAVNSVGWTAEELSYWLRRLQTGLVQNYALLMLAGVVVFVGLYWFMR